MQRGVEPGFAPSGCVRLAGVTTSEPQGPPGQVLLASWGTEGSKSYSTCHHMAHSPLGWFPGEQRAGSRVEGSRKGGSGEGVLGRMLFRQSGKASC